MLKEEAVTSILVALTGNDTIVDTVEAAYRESIEDNCIVNVTMYDDGEVETWRSTGNEMKQAEFEGTAFRIASFNNEYFECELNDDLFVGSSDGEVYIDHLGLNDEEKKIIEAAQQAIEAGEYSYISEYLAENEYRSIIRKAEDYYKKCYLHEYAAEAAVEAIDRAEQELQEQEDQREY